MLLFSIRYFPKPFTILSLGTTENNRRATTAINGIRCNTQTVFDSRDKYWYCETNDRDYEYCCRPGSTCGYSKNSGYPWYNDFVAIKCTYKYLTVSYI